jgi:hypothetical protein
MLPLLHLCACAVASLGKLSEGAIGTALLLFDFPFSIVFTWLIMYRSLSIMTTFGIFGTLWWYFLSWVAINIYRQQT